jgi:hypothetical protein
MPFGRQYYLIAGYACRVREAQPRKDFKSRGPERRSLSALCGGKAALLSETPQRRAHALDTLLKHG